MARQSVVAGELSSIFGDLAKIAMSNTANRKAQELQLESNLIELEMRQLSNKIDTTEAEFKEKKELFQQSTGQVFKLSDEERNEFVTDMVFLAQKKAFKKMDQFGPFGKIY